jgi:hypothetical protein
MKNKDRKLRKKIHKRKISIFESNEDKMIVEPVIEIKPLLSTTFDLKQNTIYDIKGKKGHTNYYAKQTLDVGVYYFEVTPTALDYNFADYVFEKRTDEFSKSYYENILANIKNYAPNIRLGFINTKGDKDICLGAEDYSYGLRVSDGALIHDGLYEFNNWSFIKGNVYGVLIHLKPPMPGFLKSGEDDRNSQCYIKFFINGVLQEKMFRGIWEGSYRPTITLYNFAQASVNFGPIYRYTEFEEFDNVKPYYNFSF